MAGDSTMGLAVLALTELLGGGTATRTAARCGFADFYGIPVASHVHQEPVPIGAPPEAAVYHCVTELIKGITPPPTGGVTPQV